MKKGIFWVFFIVGLIMIVNLSRSIYDVVKRGAILNETETRLATARSENKRLKQEYDETNTPYFIEKQARDKLNMARDDETVIIVPTVPPPTQTPTPEPPKANWELWKEVFRL